MFGHRSDGKLVKDIDPIVALTPYIMPMRCDAQVMMDFRVPYDHLARYIVEQGNNGHKISFMDIIFCAFARTISEIPQLNRFIANKRIYARKELTVSFALLQDTGDDDKVMENTVKVYLKPDDTLFEVADRVSSLIEKNRPVEEENSTMKMAKLLLNPVLANLVVGLARFIDRRGLLPRYLIDASPFHTSLFVTNTASIGLPNVKHHIYNFGTTSMFWSIGVPERTITVENGRNVRHRFLPVGVVVDERIAEGAVFSKMLTSMMRYMNDPSLLENPPEKVRWDENTVYGLPVNKKEKKA